MYEELKRLPLLAELSTEQLQWLSEHSQAITFQAGEQFFTEGDEEAYFWIVLEGEIQTYRQLDGHETELNTYGAGAFLGEISLLTHTPAISTARTLKRSRLLRLNGESFQELIVVCAPLIRVLLPSMAARIQRIEVVTTQREKLAALGKFAAGLAHELNNPAAAAQRASAQLRQVARRLQELTLALQSRVQPFSEEQRALLSSWLERALEQPDLVAELDPLDQSEREEGLADWLGEHGVTDAWELTDTLSKRGFESERLSTLAEKFAAEDLPDVLAWFEASLRVFTLLDSVEQSSGRISELVASIKSYTYMDQGPLQELDLKEGLESTLTLLRHKLKGITVKREYAPDLPRICAHGSELNQVWTNLIDNAASALEGKGQIQVRTYAEAASVVVEIVDNGPGIPAEVQSHIFEPFFTTRSVGEGSGLGLDISYTIIVAKHHGEIQLRSQPGETRFIVTLPRELA